MDFLADLIRKEAMVYAGFLCPLCMFILGWSLFYCMSASNYRLGCSGVGWKCRPLQVIIIGSFDHVIGSAILRCRHLFDEFFLVRCLWFAILIIIVVVLRYTLCVKAGDGEAVVGMVFFWDVATDLIGKPPDVLNNEFLARNDILPSDILRLVGRSYVVDVVVSRFSICREIINFQVVKFYTEGGSENMDFVSACSSSGASQQDEGYVWMAARNCPANFLVLTEG
jgi:hypothetical protein